MERKTVLISGSLAYLIHCLPGMVTNNSTLLWKKPHKLTQTFLNKQLELLTKQNLLSNKTKEIVAVVIQVCDKRATEASSHH